MESDRRNFIKNMGLLTLGAAFVPSIIKAFNGEYVFSNLNQYSDKAKKLVFEATCIDMLSTYGTWAVKRNNRSLSDLWESIPGSFTQEDFKFVLNSGMNVFGWGSMIPTYEDMLKFMALQNGLVAAYPQYFSRIDSKEKLLNINNNKKIGLLITNQESSHFRNVEDVNLFYSLGQRVSQITYNGKNKLGCGAFEDVDTGLTKYGREIIERMNKVGMAVDVSHCHDKTTLDAIYASSQPVLITHGSCRTLAKGLARAKTDEAIKAIAKSGGVVGLPILRFMVKHKEPVTIDDFLNHIDHITNLVGVQYVGIGSDQGLYTEDYYPIEYRKKRLEKAPLKYRCHTNKEYLLTIEKLNHPNRIYDIADGLIKRGYKDDEIKMILGNNFKRVLLEIFK